MVRYSRIKSYIARIIFFGLIIFFYYYQAKASGILKLDSINQIITQSSDSAKLEIFLKTAYDYSTSNPDLSIEYAKFAIELSEKLDNPKKKIQAEIIIGKSLFNKGEYTNSIEKLIEAENKTIYIKDSLPLIEIYQNYSLVYSKIGDFNKALEFSQKAFSLAGSLNQMERLADLTREVGNIYFSFGESKIALEFYQKSFDICKARNDENGMSKALNNIGRIHSELGQYAEALVYLNRSIDFKLKVDNKLGIGNTLLNIGTIYFNQKNYSKAIEHFKKANEYYKKINFVEGISNSCLFMGRSYLEINQYSLADQQLTYALEIASMARIKPLLVAIYYYQSELYNRTKKFDLAYKSLYNNKVLNDSIFSENRRSLLMELDAKYNLRAKEKQISLLSKEQELKDTQRKKLAIWNILLAVIATFLIFIIYLIYSRMRFRGSVNRQLVDEIVQRKSAEEALHKYQEHLEAIVEDRTRDLKEAKDKAEESDMLKTAFLANMSHEIRTPMNAIVGFSNLLLEEELSSDEKIDYIKQINANSDVLMNLISDIIDISMIESGQIRLNKDVFFVSDLIQSLIDQYEVDKFKMNKGHIELSSEFDEELMFIKLETDINRLKQVLSNLLSNAIKFTNEGSVRLCIKKGNHNQIVFFVKDTGIGIPPCNQSAIFERFNKFNSESDTRLYSGTGIGLTISKELVEMMGGKIWFESVINKGSTFYVSIPITNKSKKMETKTLSSTNSSVQGNFSNKTILIAEDTVSNFKLIKAYLKESNVNLLWAKDGKEVIDLLNNNIIHLILMDIQMPIMDGIQTTIEIRKMGIKTPIIIQTAYTLNNEIDKSIYAGCNDYITKPIRKDDFLTKISNYL